jgi:hypothetical protein
LNKEKGDNMNIWTILTNIWNWIVELPIIIWASICFAYDHITPAIRAFIIAQILILGTMIGLFFLGHLAGLTWLVVFSLVMSCLILMLNVFAAEALIKLITIFSGVPFTGKITDEIGKQLARLIQPTIAISLVLAWLSAVTAIRGIGYYHFSDFMVWGTVILFFAIFAAYTGVKSKLPENILAISLVVMLVTYYVAPIQILGLLDWAEKKSIRVSISASNDAKDGDLVEIPSKTPLYDYGHGGFCLSNKTETATEAKIVSRKDDPISREGLYQVILPVEKDLYIGGKIKFVPVRLVKIIKTQEKLITPNSRNASGNFSQGPISNSTYEPIPFGNSQVIIEPGQEKRVRLPDCAIWDITRDEKSEIDITPFGGKTFQWRPDKNEYAHFSNKDKMFALVNKGQTPQTLKFIIKPLGAKI